MIEGLILDAVGATNREGSHAGVVMNSSEDLITRAGNGDQEAFRQIFERYARPVLSFIYNLVGRRDVAEELTQETFVRAYRNLPELRDKTKFSTWLFGIGRNVAREHLRSKEREHLNNLSDADVIERRDPMSTSPVDQLWGKELKLAMEAALLTLDEDKRTVFALKVFQERSYQEIVLITGFSLAKVKVELHRARLEMKKRMRRFCGDESK